MRNSNFKMAVATWNEKIALEGFDINVPKFVL